MAEIGLDASLSPASAREIFLSHAFDLQAAAARLEAEADALDRWGMAGTA